MQVCQSFIPCSIQCSVSKYMCFVESSTLGDNPGGFTESQVSSHHICGQLTDVGELFCRCKAQFSLRVSVVCLGHRYEHAQVRLQKL